MRMTVDSSGVFRYRIVCECGFEESGQQAEFLTAVMTPAAPIASCVVHMRMVHPTKPLDLYFCTRFRQWLEKYWVQIGEREEVSRVARGGSIWPH